jgi:hypothetical protein
MQSHNKIKTNQKVNTQVIMMNIKSLEQMERIVKRNKALSWDGWDVIQSYPNPTAWSQKNGAFVKGKWYSQKRFKINSNGWDIPDKLVR